MTRGSYESVIARLQGRGIAARGLQLPGPESEGLPSLRAADTSGTTQGRYLVSGELARGGVGAVLCGRDLDLGRDVAIKVLHPEHAEDADVVQRFVEEAQIGGQLQHPGIVPVYELGVQEDGRPFFSMRLIRGQNLADLIADGAVRSAGQGRLLRIFLATCQTIAYAHARGVVHRDLKPANVMVGAFGEVMIVDWGMAKVLQPHGEAGGAPGRTAPGEAVRTVRTTQSPLESVEGSILGTLAYMPPEQARGDLAQVDERSDVFGLGAILCEILTGRPPYAGDFYEVHRLAMECDVGNVQRRLEGAGVDTDLLSICTRCLAREPGERPSNAGSVASLIEAYLAQVDERLRTAQVAASTAHLRMEAERRRRRLTLALAVSVLAVAAALIGAWRWNLAGERRRSEEATEAAVRAGEDTRTALRAAAQGGAIDGWRRALTTADMAVRVAEVEAVAQPVREQVNRMRQEAADQLVQAELREAARTRDERMQRRLDEIRLERASVWLAVDGEALYRTAFLEYGLDPIAMAPADAQRVLQACGIQESLLQGLHEWLGLSTARATTLHTLLEEIDPDPSRRLVRSARRDIDELRRLAADQEAVLDLSAVRLLVSALGARGDANAAAGAATRAQAKHPGDFWANFDAGFWHLSTEPMDSLRAVQFLMAACALEPRSAAAWANLSLALENSGRNADAIDACSHTLRLAPNWAMGHVNMGVFLMNQGRMAEAVTSLRRAVELAPESPRICGNLVMALISSGDVDGAVSYGATAAQRFPDSAELHQNVGAACEAAGDLASARRYLERAIGLKPDLLAARTSLSAVKSMLGDHSGAREDLMVALAYPEKSAEHWDAIGGLLGARGDLEGARAAFSEACAREPGNATYLTNLGHVLRDLHRYDEARRALSRCLELHPHHAEAHCWMGAVQLASGDLRAAQESLETASGLAQGRRTTRLHESIAELLAHVRVAVQMGEVLASIEAGAAPPEDVSAVLALAAGAHQRKQHTLSVQLYRRAFEQEPDRMTDLSQAWRYNAACAAALAAVAAAQAGGAAPPGEAVRGWRLQCIDWLRADLDEYERRITVPGGREAVRFLLTTWYRDSEIQSIRDPGHTRDLSPSEQTALHALWARAGQLWVHVGAG